MYKYILEGAGNINWMAIFALITFFTLFVIMLFAILRRDLSACALDLPARPVGPRTDG